jgi:DNA-binding transcriptional ArsR family regulator
MPETERLRRLADADDEDVDERLAALDDLESRADDGLAADLAILDALAGRTRYRLVRLLLAAEGGELAVAELDAVLAVSQSAISHALADLSDAGLVEARNRGPWRYYRATDAAERLVAALADVR